jgi:hypothetical protein
MWNELFMAQYELLSLHLSGGTEENRVNMLGWPDFMSKFEAGNSQLQSKAVEHALMSMVKVIISFQNKKFVVFLGIWNDMTGLQHLLQHKWCSG